MAVEILTPAVVNPYGDAYVSALSLDDPATCALNQSAAEKLMLRVRLVKTLAFLRYRAEVQLRKEHLEVLANETAPQIRKCLLCLDRLDPLPKSQTTIAAHEAMPVSEDDDADAEMLALAPSTSPASEKDASALEPVNAEALKAALAQPLKDTPEWIKYTGLLIAKDLTKNPDEEGATFKNVAEFRQEAADFLAGLEALADARPTDSRLKALRRGIGTVNNARRLWWVWGTSVYDPMVAIVDSFSAVLPERDRLDNAIGVAATPLGLASWIIYLFRLFAIELNEAVRDAVTQYHPHQVPSQLRFASQSRSSKLADQLWARKYDIINDLFWGIANTMTFFWLRGPLSTTLGQIGGVLNLALLGMDLISTMLRFIEAKQQYDADMLTFNDRQAALQAEWKVLYEMVGAQSHQKNLQALSERELKALLEQLVEQHEATREQTDIKKAQETAIAIILETLDIKKSMVARQLQWHYQKQQLWYDQAFTIGLVIGFAMMCGFFVPGLAGGIVVALAGAVFCFLMSVVYNGLAAGIDIEKSHDAEAQFTQQAEQLMAEWKQTTDPNQRKLLYLQIRACLARSAHQKELREFYVKRAVINGFLDGLMPVITFFSFAFLRIDIAIAAFALAVVLAIAITALLKNMEKRLNPNQHRYQSQFFQDVDSTKDPKTPYDAVEAKRVRDPESVTLHDFDDRMPTPSIDDDPDGLDLESVSSC